MVSCVSVMALSRPGLTEPTEVERALATALFNEGRTLMNERRWSEACVKFSDSQRLDPGGGTLLNLALCNEMEGKLATAWARFNEALTIAERQGREDRVVFARSHIQKLEPKLPRVMVIVKEPAPDQELTLDGAVLREQAWGTRMPLDPGEHVLKANAKGRASYTVSFEVRAEQTLSVEVPPLESQPSPAAEPPARVRQHKRPTSAAPAARGRPSSLRPWAFVSLGLGAAGISTGAITGIAALQKQSRLDDTCEGPAHCPEEQRGNLDAMNRYADVSTVAFALGAGAGVIGVVLLILDDTGPSGSTKERALGGAIPVRVSIGARSASLSASF